MLGSATFVELLLMMSTAGKKAFDSKGRSLITRDILDALSECLKVIKKKFLGMSLT
jgi:hypothetical protein